MKLIDLLKFDDIIIQCHDNPDADAIASGFGLYQYFIINGKQPRFIYSGKNQIQKKNLVMMVEELQIPIEYVTALPAPELLLLTDCQYGEGNVTRFEAKQVAMIDHHEICVEENEYTEIRSSYGSCSTVVYSMLLDEEVRVNLYKELATALYYGLYMDTNEAYPGTDFKDCIKQRMTQYFKSYKIFDTTLEIVDTTNMKYYKKLPIRVGFAKTLDFAPEGTGLMVRTLEGDVTILSDTNIFIMIGVEGEVYPIKREIFEASYQVLEEPYRIETDYCPKVRNKRTDETYFLSDYAGSCFNLNENMILAKPLTMTTKVFTKWYHDDYMLGNIGDYLAIRDDGNNDAYIVKKDIMHKTYELVSM